MHHGIGNDVAMRLGRRALDDVELAIQVDAIACDEVDVVVLLVVDVVLEIEDLYLLLNTGVSPSNNLLVANANSPEATMLTERPSSGIGGPFRDRLCTGELTPISMR